MALALENPTRGCNYLSSLLAKEGTPVSFVTVQNILNKQGLGSRYERLLALEKKALDHEIQLTPEQAKQIEQANPCFAGSGIEAVA